MTYYNEQVVLIRLKVYSNMYLVKQVMLAKYYLDRSFANKIELDDVCRAACISKFHLLRSFKKIYGQTPNQYLMALRISKAKELLQHNTTSIADACYAVGFDSTTSFAGLFKKITGQSPAAYKKTMPVKKQF